MTVSQRPITLFAEFDGPDGFRAPPKIHQIKETVLHSYTALRHETRAQTAWLTLNRPDAMNALSETLCDELADAFCRIERDRDVRVRICR